MSKNFDKIIKKFLNEDLNSAKKASQSAVDTEKSQLAGLSTIDKAAYVADLAKEITQPKVPKTPEEIVQALADTAHPYNTLDPQHAKDPKVLEHLKTLGLQPLADNTNSNQTTNSNQSSSNNNQSNNTNNNQSNSTQNNKPTQTSSNVGNAFTTSGKNV
jgi:hypothetical protein